MFKKECLFNFYTKSFISKSQGRRYIQSSLSVQLCSSRRPLRLDTRRPLLCRGVNQREPHIVERKGAHAHRKRSATRADARRVYLRAQPERAALLLRVVLLGPRVGPRRLRRASQNLPALAHQGLQLQRVHAMFKERRSRLPETTTSKRHHQQLLVDLNC